ncbi:acetylglutamate kinase [Paenisporosarcina antarctica]|uniref:Acetylglutamate kinase n=1 Tax=Paenisporosarcina antarctica TaxID=417367 RepID=A0A4P6ZV81_9BACL|nr:acetylglutamate kinase [Paenisporosarcina antarctica]QBP40251.1 acetylglutamate kinase [Paenisporosarcina antarctica]
MKIEKTVVIKCGGSIINELTSEFFQNVKQLKESGYKVIIVHGGGPDIQQTLTKLLIETEFINGLRKTSKEALEVVTMVLAGKVNKQLVTTLQQYDLNAVGLSGCDGMLLETVAIDLDTLGYVGEVVNVNVQLLELLMTSEYIPVISSIGADKNGNGFNVNADLAAGAIAQAVHAEKLMFVTDVRGVLQDGQLIPQLTKREVQQLIVDKTIYGGMIPKVTAAVNALSDTLEEVNIISGIDGFLDQDGNLLGTAIKT